MSTNQRAGHDNIHTERRRNRLVTAVAVATAPLGLSVAGAQSEDIRSSQSLEEIIVTAQKREQRLQEVPLSISAITEGTIEDSGLTSIQDLSQMAPGLLFAESIGRQTASAAIRGVATFGFGDPTVQVLLDGFTNGFGRSGDNATLLELERIEILRGPQATLYGRNAIGGIINYVTRAPDNEFRANVVGEAGSYENYLLQGSVSGPILDDRLFAGIALGYRSSGGFLDNTVTGQRDVNDEEDINARLRLRYIPTDALEVNFTFDYNEAHDAAGDPSHVPPAFFSANRPTLAQVAAGGFDFNDFTRTISQDVLGGFDREAKTIVLDVDYDFGGATLTSITGFGDEETDVQPDSNRIPGPSSFLGAFFDVIIDNESWSEELRLASNGDDRFNWLVGAYYFKNERHRLLTVNGGPPRSNSDVEVENSAVFAHVEYGLTDSLFLSGGLRFDTEERIDRNNFTGVAVSADFEEWLPSVTLSYRPSDNLNVYGLVSRGYHSGAPNSSDAVAAGAPPFYDAEYVTNYEIGIKGSSDAGQFGYEMAAFFMDWTDQQISTSLTATTSFVTNAGKSEIKGLEFSARYSPIVELDLSLTLSLLDTEYTDYVDAIRAAPFGIDPQLAGNELVFAADVSGSLSAQYGRPVGAGRWSVRLRGDANYVGERPFDVTNLLIADAYTVVNLYAGFEDERYEFGLFVDNALDEKYLNGGFLPSVAFPPLLSVGDPRIYGARVRMRF